jgi:hypothetical protein
MGDIVPLHRDQNPAGPAPAGHPRRLDGSEGHHPRRLESAATPRRSRDDHPRRLGGTAEPLWRELVGEELRAVRHDRGERLVDVAERAGVSPQYLSEVERGLKDPSSEMLAAVAGSLGLTVRQLTVRAARVTAQASGPTLCVAA